MNVALVPVRACIVGEGMARVLNKVIRLPVSIP
jgi:hypothetical protein